MFIDSIITNTTIGKKKRLYRILGEYGKSVIVALDDNLISANNVGLLNLKDKINTIENSDVNGILCYYGTASLVTNNSLPLILNITASTVQSKHTKKVLISSVKQAVTMDAAAVAVHINISSEYESEMISILGTVSEECNMYGMPLFVIIYPRKEGLEGDENYQYMKENDLESYTTLISHCVRIAFELGADIIKTQYTGDEKSFKKVVDSANGRPVLIAGGSLCEEKKLYDMIQGAMNAGASGVCIGRNVFNRDNSSIVIKNIKEIVF